MSSSNSRTSGGTEQVPRSLRHLNLYTLSQAGNDPQRRIIVLADTVNLYRRVRAVDGPASRPDYGRIIADLGSLGHVVRAVALFNDGVPARFPEELRQLGFFTRFSHARDLDDALVAEAVRLHQQADCIVIASHDGDYRHLASLLRASGRELVVCAIRNICSRRLLVLASAFYELPVTGQLAVQ